MFYVNGIALHTTSGPSSVGCGCQFGTWNIANDLEASHSGALPFDGMIDEVEVFERALWPEEISRIYQAGRAGKCKPDDGECVPAPTDLFAWWPLDETTGNTAEDIAGGNDGSYNNGPTPAVGMVDASLEFNGVNQSVSAPEVQHHDPADVTIDAWINPDRLGTGNCMPWGACPTTIIDYSVAGGSVIYHFSLDFRGDLVFGPCNDRQCYYLKTDGAAIPARSWSHVAVTADTFMEEVKFYVNGNLVDCSNCTYVGSTYDSYGFPRLWTIGDLRWGDSLFDGRIDELEVFERALSEQEIRSIVSAGSSGKCKGEPPTVVCNDPVLDNDAGQCGAFLDCDGVAFCFDPDGDLITQSCDPTGPYPVGTTDVTVECSDGRYTTTEICTVTVEDEEPPELTVELAPSTLWPPNHRMVDVVASAIASDNCGTPAIVLTSVSSDEPDNAVGTGDGDTINDVQDADFDAPDFEFSLRAERSGSGDGRAYTVTYTAVDGSGNESSAQAMVEVPHDQGGLTEPVGVSLEENGSGTMVEWARVPGAQSYNVIRGLLSSIRNLEPAYDLGTVICVEAGSGNENTSGDEDADQPAPGEVFFYLVEYDDGLNSSYGTESAAKPRLPRVGDCQ